MSDVYEEHYEDMSLEQFLRQRTLKVYRPEQERHVQRLLRHNRIGALSIYLKNIGTIGENNPLNVSVEEVLARVRFDLEDYYREYVSHVEEA